MAKLQNVFRSNAVHWFRRNTNFEKLKLLPITICISLRTKDVAIARIRAAAVMMRSEEVRMSLYEAQDKFGLTNDQKIKMPRDEMRKYVVALELIDAGWKTDGISSQISDNAQDINRYEALWGALGRRGVPKRGFSALKEKLPSNSTKKSAKN